MTQVGQSMAGVVLCGHGGPEQLAYRTDLPRPVAGLGEVLIAVAAAGVNNTDLNTRLGWYAAEHTGATDATPPPAGPGDWRGGGLSFPRIQGADLCGRIVAVGPGVDPARIGQRVLVQPCLVSQGGDQPPWLGSDRDGAFAQFATAPAADTHAVTSALSDAELAAIPCAYGTADNLLERAGVGPGGAVLVTGASGNVGLAAVALAQLRGARVTALAAPSKAAAVAAMGAAAVLGRDAVLDPGRFDAVIDVVGGPDWPRLLDLLRPGGRIAVAGAIAGAVVPLDLRRLYLRDLTVVGATAQTAAGFARLLDLLARGLLRPPVTACYPLADIAEAQAVFAAKTGVGKIVLIPPA